MNSTELVCTSEHGCGALTALICRARRKCIDSPEERAQRENAQAAEREQQKAQGKGKRKLGR